MATESVGRQLLLLALAQSTSNRRLWSSSQPATATLSTQT